MTWIFFSNIFARQCKLAEWQKMGDRLWQSSTSTVLEPETSAYRTEAWGKPALTTTQCPRKQIFIISERVWVVSNLLAPVFIIIPSSFDMFFFIRWNFQNWSLKISKEGNTMCLFPYSVIKMALYILCVCVLRVKEDSLLYAILNVFFPKLCCTNCQINPV